MTDLDVTYFRLMTEHEDTSPGGRVSSRVTPEQLRRLATVWAAAIDVWKEEEAAIGFLRRRHAMLNDRTPIDVALQSETGVQSVRDILKRLQFGTAA